MVKKNAKVDIHLNIPKNVLDEFDQAWPGHYGDRTAAVTDLMREFTKYRRAIKAAKEA